jgi:tetratricopeptide (TPR) repeat protein
LAIAASSGVIDAIDWSPDGRSIASVGTDGRLHIWDASKGYRLVADPTFVSGQTLRRRRDAQRLAERGSHQRACDLFTEVLKWKPEDTEAVRGRAEVRARMGQWRQAADDFARLCELEPENPLAMCASALVHLRAEDTTHYRQDCEMLLKMASQPNSSAQISAAWACMLDPKSASDLPGVEEAIDRAYGAAKKILSCSSSSKSSTHVAGIRYLHPGLTMKTSRLCRRQRAHRGNPFG